MNSENPDIDKLCQCCLSAKFLRSITEPYLYYGKLENYSNMLTTCFSEMVVEKGQICKDCIRRLRATLNFRQCVESARQHFISFKMTPMDNSFTTGTESIICNTLESISDDISNDYRTSEVASTHKNNDTDKVSITSETNCGDYNMRNEPDPKKDNASHLKSDSEDEQEELEDIFSYTTEATPVFDKNSFDVGEMKTLPYELYPTDRVCQVCKKEFSFYSDLAQHMPEHFPNHICDVCGKICATRKSLFYHAKIHTDVRLDCELCDKSFKNKSNMNAHVKVKHKGEKIWFKCSQCGEKLSTYNARIKHMAAKHGREEKAYKCSQCSSRYILASHLRTHVKRVHLQEKNHKCHICGSSFFNQRCLKLHIAKHSDVKEYSYDNYNVNDSLDDNTRSHEGDNVYMSANYSNCQPQYSNQKI